MCIDHLIQLSDTINRNSKPQFLKSSTNLTDNINEALRLDETTAGIVKSLCSIAFPCSDRAWSVIKHEFHDLDSQLTDKDGCCKTVYGTKGEQLELC